MSAGRVINPVGLGRPTLARAFPRQARMQFEPPKDGSDQGRSEPSRQDGSLSSGGRERAIWQCGSQTS